MKKKIYFIIGLSNKIGSGHFFRSMCLAKHLKTSGIEIFLISYDPSIRLFLNKTSNQRIFKKIFILKNNFEEKSFFKKNEISNLYIDNPKIGLQKQLFFSKNSKNIIIYQDEPKKSFANIIINHNYIPDVTRKYRKLVSVNTKLLLGIQYFPIDFKKIFIKKSKEKQIKSITIFFGSQSNLRNIQNSLIYINSKNLNLKIDCFLGIYNKHFSQLEKKFKNVKFYKNTTQKFFLKKLSKSDLFIGSGGTTLIESLYLGVPSLVSCTAKNQISNCENFSKKRIIIFIKNRNFYSQLDELFLKKQTSQYNRLKTKTSRISKIIGKKSISKKLIKLLK